MLPVIDTHQHLWDLTRLELPWTQDVPGLNRSFQMSDYLEASEGQNVVKTVYMEVDARPDQRQVEVDLISELCREMSNPMQAAVFCSDPSSPDFKGFLKRNRENPCIRGLRRVLHNPDIPRGCCLSPEFIDNVRRLGELNWHFEVCLRPAELDDAVELVRSCPDTLFVLDPCGNANPQIIQGMDSEDTETDDPFQHNAKEWKDAIRCISEEPNTFCKISGIISRVKPDWNDEILAPAVNHCIDSFGEERVFFGGDWPVCTLGAPLSKWIASLRRIIKDRQESLQRKLLHDNAERIYRLN